MEISEMNDLGLEPIPYSDKAPRVEKSRKVVYHSIHSVSWRWPVIALMIGCLTYYIVHLLDDHLPYVVSEQEAIAKNYLFSGERSRDTLRRLVRMGPRVVGTPQNRIMAPAIISEELEAAKRNAHSAQYLQYETQRGSGAYTLEYNPRFTNVYDSIQNVVAILEGTDPTNGILVNCHYDSVPTSDGASDDAISCAVMLEIVRVLTQSKTRLKHNVIFLFNGAEETSLQGSHMFLQHRWAKTCRVVLNLEAAGQGGRSILFQSGPKNAWIFNYYARNVPHPHGLIVGEELFQSGALPSDSDYRIFRDYGNMPGLDFAFSRNGYAYHTIYDKEEYIPTGSHQHMGDNTLALVRALGFAPEIENIQANSEGQVVYFDYLGWFMVRYSMGAGVAINIIVVLLSIFSVVVFIGRMSEWQWLPQSMGKAGELWDKKFKSHDIRKNDALYSHVGQRNGSAHVTYSGSNQGDEPDQNAERKTSSKNEENVVENGTIDTVDSKAILLAPQSVFVQNPWLAWIELAYAVGARIGGMLAGLLATVIMAAIIDGTASLTMPWFTNVWVIFPLFWCPCLAGCGLVPVIIDWWRDKKRGLSLSMTTQLNLVATQIPWTIVLFIMTCAGYRSAAIVMVPVLFSALANLLIHLTPLYRTVHKWVWVYLVCHIPSVIFQMYIVLMVYMMFIPVMGRSGTVNGDMYIGLMSAILIFYLLNFSIPLLGLVRKPGLVLGLLFGFGILMLPISLTTSIGHPYRAGPDTPRLQRFWIMHSERSFYNEMRELRRHETGYFVLNLDRNSPRTIELGDRNITSLNKDCDDELYCGVPLYVARMVPLSRTSSWIPSTPPVIPSPTAFTIAERNCTSMTSCNIKFLIKGPIRVTLTFAPRDGVSVAGWSLPTEPIASGEWKGRPTYFLHIVRGDATEDFPLSITFNVTDSVLPMVDVGLAGNHIHHDEQRTLEFKGFLNKFADWTQMTGWISTYAAHVF